MHFKIKRIKELNKLIEKEKKKKTKTETTLKIRLTEKKQRKRKAIKNILNKDSHKSTKDHLTNNNNNKLYNKQDIANKLLNTQNIFLLQMFQIMIGNII